MSVTKYNIEEYDAVLGDLRSLKDRAYYVLEKFPETANDDELLYFRLAEEFLGVEIPSAIFESYIRPIIQSFDFGSIRRIRQAAQERGLFLPTDPKVAEKRRRRSRVYPEALKEVIGDD